jgi:hypothetical protein
MPQNPNEVHDLRDAPQCALPEDALEKGLAGLARAATELGAKSLAVLVLEAASVEIAYRRTASCEVRAGRIECRAADVRDALTSGSGPVPAESPVAAFLASAVALDANSFLLFPWRARRRVVTIVFGFAEPQPPHTSLPAHVVESLNLAALAAWSLQEVNRLHAELRIVNDRFSGRKLVERAKATLQAERGMNEQQAYEYLRKMSRQRRIAMAKLAEDLLGTARWP